MLNFPGLCKYEACTLFCHAFSSLLELFRLKIQKIVVTMEFTLPPLALTLPDGGSQWFIETVEMAIEREWRWCSLSLVAALNSLHFLCDPNPQTGVPRRSVCSRCLASNFQEAASTSMTYKGERDQGHSLGRCAHILGLIVAADFWPAAIIVQTEQRNDDNFNMLLVPLLVMPNDLGSLCRSFFWGLVSPVWKTVAWDEPSRSAWMAFILMDSKGFIGVPPAACSQPVGLWQSIFTVLAQHATTQFLGITGRLCR